ncbi:phosphate propanoyltransferase [Paenibacillus sp. BSR1-1]|uniref:phosphate propanoyltransferase n=1 Tax=Paenibacillus sp. BSR1-1 TaxID=3020845 RepID=UPI0025B147CA|nr:phosphate propanoyltransferase [Paenibacillus sp. BSR1-1]MDN3016934.1 phosphate propanoyltransferase [Paenibacillus sp. BSR1-1]
MAIISESKLRAMLKNGIPNPFILGEGEKLTPSARDFLRERRIEVKQLYGMKKANSANLIAKSPLIPVGVSNRHIHLSPKDVEALFGSSYQLTTLRELSQPGQFAAKEQVSLLGPKGIIQNVRILGPARGETQVEISISDGFQIGIHPPVRLSGSIEDTPGLTLIGPKGCVVLEKGVIIAKRHVHLSPDDAKDLNVEQGDRLLLETTGDRRIIFSDVIVRVNPGYCKDFHVDLDEGNAAGLKTGDLVKIIGKNDQFYLNGR